MLDKDPAQKAYDCIEMHHISQSTTQATFTLGLR